MIHNETWIFLAGMFAGAIITGLAAESAIRKALRDYRRRP